MGKTLASGEYRYWRDGQRQPVVEPWTLARGDNGLVLRCQRITGGVALLEVEAHYHGTACKQLQLVWAPGQAGSARRFVYHHGEAQLEWQRDGQAARVLPLPAGGCPLYPLVRAATGPLLIELARGARQIVLPDLRDPDSAQALEPILSARRAEFTGDADESGERYRFFGGEYGDTGADYWLGEHDLVMRYTWASAGGDWDVRLEDLDCDPGFSGFGEAAVTP